MKKQFSGTILGHLFLVRLAFPVPCFQYDLYDEKVSSCPGPDVMAERVKIRYKGAQLKISCMKCEVKSNEVTSYLKSIPIPQNLTRVMTRHCLLPPSSFKVWLQSMNSSPGRLKELEVSLFTNCSTSGCPAQWAAHPDYGPCHLHSNLFEGLHSLQHLRLFLDLTTSLPGGVFDDLVNLRNLTVKGRLSSIDQGLLANLKELRYLDLGGNQLARSPSLDQMAKLEQLYIGHNRISRLNRDMLLYNSELVLFKATNNAISQIPDNFFNSCLSLKTIWLDRNNLTSLSKGLLQNLSSLTFLSLASNRLRNADIDAKAFQDLKNIKKLHLEHNMLTSPLGDIIPISKTLSDLVLTNNMLTVFENTWHKKWPKLEKLKLESNNLGLDENLHSKLFDFFDRDQNIEIILAKNTITNFPLLFPKPQKNQIVIDLRDNKLKCDCQTQNLWKLIKLSNQSIRIEGDVRCLNLNNQLLAEVNPSKLSCPFPCEQVSPKLLTQDCACQYFPALRETKVNCSGKSIPTAKSPQLASINRTKTIKFYQNHRNMTTLSNIFDERTKELIKLFDVSHNNISSFSFSQLPPKLKSLFLNNNNIKTLEISTELKNIPDLRLGGNPFACDCRSLSLIQFLQHFGSKVTDKDDISFDCGTLKPFKTNVTFDKSFVCPDQLPVYLGLSLVMAIILVLILVYVTSNKERLQFCLFSHPWMRRLHSEDWSLPYDVFISFSHHQEDFAEELRHHLENETYPGYR